MLRKSIQTLLAGLACVCLTSTPVLANAETIPECAGATGAAYGLCVAATHLGCGTENEKSGQACTKIEDNYLKLTGEMPPWLVTCPCWTAAILQSQGEFEECGDNFPDFPGMTAFRYSTSGEFGLTGPMVGGPPGVLACGVYTSELGLIYVTPITEDESAACARQIMSLCANPIN